MIVILEKQGHSCKGRKFYLHLKAGKREELRMYSALLKSKFRGLFRGPVVELADTQDLGSCAARCAGSTPARANEEEVVSCQ
jgi:hypothetical protein